MKEPLRPQSSARSALVAVGFGDPRERDQELAGFALIDLLDRGHRQWLRPGFCGSHRLIATRQERHVIAAGALYVMADLPQHPMVIRPQGFTHRQHIANETGEIVVVDEPAQPRNQGIISAR